MSRSRRMPPLFEVMHEANKKATGAPNSPPVAGGTDPAATSRAPSPGAGKVFPRITSVPEDAATHGRATEVATPLWDADHARTSGRRIGIRVSFVGVWLALAAVLVAMLVTAVIAYKSGAEDEKNRLLATRNDPPPSLGDSTADQLNQPSAATDRTTTGSDVNPPTERRGNTALNNSAVLPVFGDDPRQKGTNYLIVAKLFLKDATAAAQYLTENGVPCVVVPPEGVDSLKLQEDRRGNWLVVVRSGYASDEFSKPAAEAQRAEIMKKVKQLGRRWKEDRKGASSFADSFWDKYGR
ncbi:MAG: hypothetical protein H7210_03495 [Pyrinomonadaceae bacterium]|nr:hypothetical protein [Phycisphaerales bacterium]